MLFRSRTKELLNGYLDLPQVTTDAGLEEFISPSVWKKEGTGLVGALAMAKVAYEEQQQQTSASAVDFKALSSTDRSSWYPSSEKLKFSSNMQYQMKSLAMYLSIFALGKIWGSKSRKY